ncbi:MAG: hypothetical protein ACMUIM_12190, partial [bacterium]
VPLNPQHELWAEALEWRNTLTNYAFDTATIAAMEAENKEKINAYLQYYEKEVKGTEHVLYLRPEDGIRME